MTTEFQFLPGLGYTLFRGSDRIFDVRIGPPSPIESSEWEERKTADAELIATNPDARASSMRCRCMP